MKLGTLRTNSGFVVVAVVESEGEQRFLPLTQIDPSIPNSMRELLQQSNGLEKCRAALQRGLQTELRIDGTLMAPIPDPGKIICIGLNYRDHAEESGMDIPEEPVCFSKFGNSIIGPGEAIRLPRVSSKVDYEAELVVVIGKAGYEIPKEKAFEHVAGYCNGHDVSARDWQIGKPGKQWLLGKTPDTFAPIGPWLVAADEIDDPHNLELALRLNGERMQTGNTREFIFGIDEVIAYISQIVTLQPGDIIFTGTPPGVGMGRDPQVWLQPGDTVEVEVSGLGVLSNPVIGPQ
ncbi:Ureidoglycolate lyase [Thalassoglobus neptunius]|uniref:Ureidoglycolate lyase n=1 Tax=Thalassoglobus neptunius TaxID=1938619 RepID=A0A5C5X2F6_9PLAN|nr:fumarylacetoacetate hydrolase family protein [Thalassoglobus neptunius]TWT57304.1 Ureidoglycolate lyase [Thalassoglobus neptunius]